MDACMHRSMATLVSAARSPCMLSPIQCVPHSHSSLGRKYSYFGSIHKPVFLSGRESLKNADRVPVGWAVPAAGSQTDGSHSGT